MTSPPQLAAETTAASYTLTYAATAQAAQAAVSAAAMRDAISLWKLLDKNRLSETFPAWLKAMMLLIRTYHPQSSAAAGIAYRTLRAAHTQSPAPTSLIKVAPLPDQEWLAKAFRFSGPGMLSRDTARPNTALSTTLGTTARIVQDGGRTTTIDTVHADPVAVGWYRLTDGQPCPFCALLASRGIAYKSERSADFQAHNDCGCTAIPAFSHATELPDVTHQALEVYKTSTRGVVNKDRLPAFRKAWAAHQASA